MQEQSNQLPPEFDHLRDSEFPDVIIPESPLAQTAETSPRRAIKSALGLTYVKALIGLASIVVIALLAKQLIQPSQKSVSEHYQALEQLDSDTPKVTSKITESIERGELKTAAEQSAFDTDGATTKPSMQQYELAQADTKKDEITELEQASDSKVDQRLSLVEDAVKKLLMANEGHAQSIELLRNEQAQLMLKMQSNDTALTDMRGRVESLHNKLTQPKNTSSNGNQTPSKGVQPANIQRENLKTTNLVGSTQSVKPIELAQVTLTPPKSRVQLPAGVRLVSLKNLNGKNTAVIRIGGDFSPMLFEGQSWNGIQILSARVYERSAQVMYQGDEFGLVL